MLMLPAAKENTIVINLFIEHIARGEMQLDYLSVSQADTVIIQIIMNWYTDCQC